MFRKGWEVFILLQEDYFPCSRALLKSSIYDLVDTTTQWGCFLLIILNHQKRLYFTTAVSLYCETGQLFQRTFSHKLTCKLIYKSQMGKTPWRHNSHNWQLIYCCISSSWWYVSQVWLSKLPVTICQIRRNKEGRDRGREGGRKITNH